jgi:hypothetical protein
VSVEARVERLLGREVRSASNRRIGRIEEFRAEVHDGECQILEFVIGLAGLYERLGLGVKMIVGKRGSGYVARWDQMDLSDPDHPRLTCPVDDLTKI